MAIDSPSIWAAARYTEAELDAGVVPQERESPCAPPQQANAHWDQDRRHQLIAHVLDEEKSSRINADSSIIAAAISGGVEMSCFETLKEKGYRLTPQRLMVLETLHEADNHLSAPEILSRVQSKYPYVNKSTVYRTLELLKELGLVMQTEMGGDTLCYHHAEKGHHHHLICEKCGQTVEIDEGVFAPVDDTLRSKYQFRADLKHLAIRGRCFKCQT